MIIQNRVLPLVCLKKLGFREEKEIVMFKFNKIEEDFVCAAEFATTENVNFMAINGKGLICVPMSEAIVNKLQIPQMVDNNTDNHSTAFTVSIDHVDTTTGISAAERGITARESVNDNVKPEDFRRPGHMFP